MSNVPAPPPPGEVPPDPFGAPTIPPSGNRMPPHAPAASPPGMPPPPGNHQEVPPEFPQAPQGYQPFGAVAATPPKSGMLLAGGIVAVVIASFTILVGLAIALIGNAFSGFGGGIGASIVLIGMVVTAFGGFGLASGIGAIMRRRWGRICSIVYGSINAAFSLAGLASEPDGGGVVWLGMSAAVVLLCALGPASPT